MSHNYLHPHPAVTTDIVVFSSGCAETRVLLIERGGPPYQGSWSLPGGFVEIDESLEACAHRELREETGIEDIALEQFHCFGEPGRDPRERVITVAYFGVLDSGRVAPRPGGDAAALAWFPVDRLPPLAFDHGDIIAMARERYGRCGS